MNENALLKQQQPDFKLKLDNIVQHDLFFFGFK